jgi:hypothetical protein
MMPSSLTVRIGPDGMEPYKIEMAPSVRTAAHIRTINDTRVGPLRVTTSATAADANPKPAAAMAR